MTKLPFAISLCALVGCGGIPSTTQKHKVAQRTVALHIKNGTGVKALGRGALVTWWITADDSDDPVERFVSDLSRTTVTPVSDFSRNGIQVTLEVPPDATGIRVLFDNQGVFLPAYLGREHLPGADVPLVETALGSNALDVALSLSKKERNKELCTAPGLQRIPVELPSAADATNSARFLCARVPQSSKEHPNKRYPVLYLLPGLGSHGAQYLEGKNAIGKAIDDAGLELIAVGVDTSTKTGSAYFTNHRHGGQWLDAFENVVQAVESNLPAKTNSACRYLMGQSTGGFNSVYLSLTKPEYFGGVVSSAPDGLDLAHWLATPSGTHLKPRWRDWNNLEIGLAEARFPNFGQFISYALSWSPQENNPPAMVADRKGRLHQEIWSAWLEHSPINLLSEPKKRGIFKQHLADKLFVIIGRNDEFGLYPPAKQFSRKLRSMEIPHEFVTTEDGHGGQHGRFKRGLEFLKAKPCLKPGRSD